MLCVRRCEIALVAWGLAGTSAPAEPVTWVFTGTATTVEIDQGSPADLITLGSPLHGIITFDQDTPDDLPLDPVRGAYAVGASWTMSFTLGGCQSIDDPLVTEPVFLVTNDFPSVPPGTTFPDSFDLLETVVQFGADHGVVWMSLIDLNGLMFTNDELSAEPPVIEGLALAEFGLITGGIHARSTLTSLTRIPEPAMGLIVGCGAWAILRRRD